MNLLLRIINFFCGRGSAIQFLVVFPEMASIIKPVKYVHTSMSIYSKPQDSETVGPMPMKLGTYIRNTTSRNLVWSFKPLHK